MKKGIAAGAALLIAGFILRFAARGMDGFSDAYASRMNAFRVNTLGRLSSLFPFSVAEWLIYLVLAWLFIFLIRLIVKLVKKRGGVKRQLARGLVFVLVAGSFVFFMYEAGEDVYFYGTSFSETCGYGTGSYTTDELEETCRMIAAFCNVRAGSVERDGNGRMTVTDGIEERAAARMEELGETYPSIAGWYPRPKGITFSIFMSCMDFAGIYASYTCEANYNRDMADYNKPFTMCHELSHVHGVLQENEANFVAFLACFEADDPELAYAGALTGWVYCGNELCKRDVNAWAKVNSLLDERVLGDLEENTVFWSKYKKTKSAQAVQSANDAYLKGHGQTAGVESYNQVVDLIVSWYTQQD